MRYLRSKKKRIRKKWLKEKYWRVVVFTPKWVWCWGVNCQVRFLVKNLLDQGLTGNEPLPFGERLNRLFDGE